MTTAAVQTYQHTSPPDSSINHEEHFVRLETDAYDEYLEQSSYSSSMPRFSEFFATYLRTHS